MRCVWLMMVQGEIDDDGSGDLVGIRRKKVKKEILVVRLAEVEAVAVEDYRSVSTGALMRQSPRYFEQIGGK
ncbi:hypothetical protein DITRI_Ditri06bG0005700 [Diplodiscus trichospermus]